MTRLLILFFILPFVLMALSIAVYRSGNSAAASIKPSQLREALAGALSIASGGFGLIAVFLILTLILLDEDSPNRYYNVLLLFGYGFVVFKAQRYTLTAIKGKAKPGTGKNGN